MGAFVTKKIKVVRVVTASVVVPWHLENTLKRLPADFETCVVGQDVSAHQNAYPSVKFVDININRKLSILDDWRALILLCRFFLEYKPDIVHSIMHKAALLAALAGFICRVPVRINTFTSQYWATKRGLPRVVYYVSDWIVNALNTICLTDSPSQSEFLREHNISIGRAPLPVLVRGSLSGVDLERFDPRKLSAAADRLRTEIGLRKENFVFVFLARKERDKGAIDLLVAFSSVSKAHPNARLLFVGPDESHGQIDAMRKSNPDIFDNVIDIDRAVDNREDYFAVSDVLCLPSYKEGFGSVVIEAAALGIPTIGSNIPGLVDSIEDGETGVLFPAGDVEALTKTMLNFVANPEKSRNMQLSARKRVEKYFSADLMYQALKDVYLGLVPNDGRLNK
jgi:glycosyltransferase involved in cell wall biosynthesis